MKTLPTSTEANASCVLYFDFFFSSRNVFDQLFRMFIHQTSKFIGDMYKVITSRGCQLSLCQVILTFRALLKVLFRAVLAVQKEGRNAMSKHAHIFCSPSFLGKYKSLQCDILANQHGMKNMSCQSNKMTTLCFEPKVQVCNFNGIECSRRVHLFQLVAVVV